MTATLMTGPSGVTSVSLSDGAIYYPVDGVFSIPTAQITEALDCGLTLPTGTSSASSSNTAAMQPLLNKLARGLEDLTILVVGDSTGTDTTRWVWLLTNWLAQHYPALTVKYTLWDGVGLNYPALTTVQTGSGARTLTVYNCSVSGVRTTYCQGGLWATSIAALTPDLILVSHGHNQGTSTTTWWADHLNLTEALAEQCPQAGIVLVVQNPAQANNNQQLRASIYEQLARARGYGLVNVQQAFLDWGSTWATGLLVDGIHPNSAGSTIWVNEVAKLFTGWSRTSPILPLLPPSILQRGFQLLKNNDFATFTDGTIPTNWSQLAGTATYAKDVTNYESANGYSLLLTATGAAGSAIGQSLPINLVRGKWVTALVRQRVTNGAASTVGLVALYGNNSGTVKNNDGGAGDTGGAFRWVVVSKYIDPTDTTARLYLYADSSTGNGAANFDYSSVVLGRLPMR